jgi:hypothetical protein
VTAAAITLAPFRVPQASTVRPAGRAESTPVAVGAMGFADRHAVLDLPRLTGLRGRLKPLRAFNGRLAAYRDDRSGHLTLLRKLSVAG